MQSGTLTFPSQHAWESWLEANAGTAPGIWLRIAKKGAHAQTVSYAEALESALCYGWIDSRKQAENDDYWLQRFTPRSPTSIWSKINRKKAEDLVAAGRMRPAGMREIDRAKEDGRWGAAYASARTSTVPDDLQQALDANPRARSFFETLDSRNRYAILFRIQTVKKAETRGRKIAQFVAMLANGEKLHP